MNSCLPTDEEEVTESARIIAKGSALLIVSLGLGYLFSFIRGILVVRTLPTNQYGLYSLGLSVMTIITVVCSVGMFESTQRFIAMYRGRGDYSRAKGAAYSAARILMVSVLVSMALLMLLAHPIQTLLKKPGFAWVLFTLGFLVPPMIIIGYMGAFFQGFEIALVKAVFIDIFYTFLVMMVTILAVILRPTLGAMIVSWIIGAVVASIAVLLFGIVREPKPLRRIKPHYEYRTLLLFAIPLALALDLNVLTVQVDTLILGYFRNATQVGLYNAAISLSQIIPVFLIAIGFMFAPVAARLVGEDRERHIPYFYRMATKWLLVFSLPLWLLFVMYPAFSIQIVIGARYHEAALALRILSAGQFIALCFGPAFLTLVAFGRTKLLLINAAFGAASNTILNLILVPRYGINGAAISTATVIAVMGAVMLLEVYIGYRIHPFDVRYFKPFFVTIIVSGLLFWPLRLILQHHHFVLPFYYVLLLAISAGSVFLTRCVDETEMHLLRAAIDRLMSYLRGDSGE